MTETKLINNLLDVIKNKIAPLTALRVEMGCKIFGAAILRKADLSLVVAETNMEAYSPLWHGEVYAIKKFWEMQDHPKPEDCIMLSTHQPCCMCASAIAWSGFSQLYYYFGYEETTDLFHIPHDQKMIKELFNCKTPAATSSYYTSKAITEMISYLPNYNDFIDKTDEIDRIYAELSAIYQSGSKKMVLK